MAELQSVDSLDVDSLDVDSLDVDSRAAVITANDFGQQSLASIQTHSPLWQEHHISDPGVTILELLCVHMSKLSADLALPLSALLQQRPKGDSDALPLDAFYSEQQILPSNWVTEGDIKRLVVDQQGVKNVVVELTGEAGRYRLMVDLQDDFGFDDIDESTGLFTAPLTLVEKKVELKNQIRQCFLEQRNVNQDINSILFIEKQAITVGLHLSLAPVDDPYAVVLLVFQRLQQRIAQAVPQYSKDEMLSQGSPVEPMYSGPLLKHGFIKNSDLSYGTFDTKLYSSDLLAEVNDIEGLASIINFTIYNSNSTNDINTTNEGADSWQIEIGENKVASFDVVSSYQTLTVDIAGQPLLLMPLNDFLRSMQESIASVNVPPTMVIAPVQMVDHQALLLKQYRSVQESMPSMYELKEESARQESDSPKWRQLMQLKGYLLLFDQVLADQQSQVAQLKVLFALPDNSGLHELSRLFQTMFADQCLNQCEIECFWNAVRNLPITYSSQAVDGIPGREHLINADDEYQTMGFQKLADPAFSLIGLQRLKRLYEHLLARFALSMPSAKLLKYDVLLSRYVNPLLAQQCLTIGLDTQHCVEKLVLLKQIVDLYTALQEYPALSQRRCASFDYLNGEPKKDYITGLAASISRQLGINRNACMPLATQNQEGFYLLESGLLNFRNSSLLEDNELLLDFNDYKLIDKSLYFVIPDWPARFANSDFRTVMEEIIRAQCPAHQQVSIVYLPRNLLSLFERLYYAWLNAMGQLSLDDTTLGVTAIGQWNRVNQQAELLRLFIHQPATFQDSLLTQLTTKELLSYVNSWLTDEESILEDTSDLWHDLLMILLSRDDTTLDAVALVQHIKDNIAQHSINKIFRFGLIGEAYIAQNFAVRYPILDNVKTSYPLSNARIKPDNENQARFTVAIKTPKPV